MRHEHPAAYAPITSPGRTPPAWATPLVLAGLAAVAALFMLGGTLALGAWAELTGQGLGPGVLESWGAQLALSAILLGAMAGLTLLWVSRFERRSLATARGSVQASAWTVTLRAPASA